MEIQEGARTTVLERRKVLQKIERLAHQLYEQHADTKELVLVGVAPSGSQLSKLLMEHLSRISPIKIRHATLTIEKDKRDGGEIYLDLPLEELANQTVCLVDDVLNSGRTLMYAARYLLGVPLSKLSTLVLIDRLHRQFPIRADMVGMTLSTTLHQHIRVDLTPGKEAAYLH